jgi:outer membrane protein
MFGRVTSPLPWSILFWSAFAGAQAPAGPVPGAAAAPAAPPGNNPRVELLPQPPTAGSGPDAPVSPVTLALEARLRQMETGNGLTADQVAARAMAKSPQLEAKRRSLEAANADVSRSRAGFAPDVTLRASYTRLSHIDPPSIGTLGTGGLVVSGPTDATRPLLPSDPLFVTPVPDFTFPVVLNNYSLEARLTVPLSDYVLRLSHNLEASRRSRQAAELDEQATRLSIARDARVAYYQWIGAQGRAYVAMQGVEQTRGHQADAKNAFDAGLLSKADVMAAQSQLKSAELFAERSKNAVFLAGEQLRVLMQDPSDANYQVGENILVDLPPLAGIEQPDAAVREAISKRLELRRIEESEAALHEQATAARQAGYPRLDATAGAVYANPNPRYFPQREKWNATWDAGVVLSWKPTAMFGSEAGGKSLDAQAAALNAQRAELRDALRLEVSQSITAAQEAIYALATSRQALEAAEESYRVRRELFRAGRATLVEVSDAETSLTRARLEVVNAHVDVRLTRVQLEHALGRDVKRQ